jgi:hypothetical protein
VPFSDEPSPVWVASCWLWVRLRGLPAGSFNRTSVRAVTRILSTTLESFFPTPPIFGKIEAWKPPRFHRKTRQRRLLVRARTVLSPTPVAPLTGAHLDHSSVGPSRADSPQRRPAIRRWAASYRPGHPPSRNRRRMTLTTPTPHHRVLPQLPLALQEQRRPPRTRRHPLPRQLPPPAPLPMTSRLTRLMSGLFQQRMI